jgi:hypothetical protein
MKCVYCNEEFTGRSDKIYCDAYCKSAHYYQKQKNNEKTTFFKQVDLQLKTNRKILKHLNVEGYVTVKKTILKTKGFNPNFFTHYWKNKKGDVYLFCYEYGFLSLKNNKRDYYLLVQWQEYMGDS